jgi:hypothetical protein
MVLRWDDGSRSEEKELEPGWVRWIMVVLSSHCLYGCRAAKGERSRGEAVAVELQ